MVDYFPAYLTAQYSDRIGSLQMTFIPLTTGEFTYSILFREEVIEFDYLDELCARLPNDGNLIFALPLQFHRLKGECAQVDLQIIVTRDLEHHGALFYQCVCCIDDQLYRSAALSDWQSRASEWGLEGALIQIRRLIKPIGNFRACFFCKYSDYEPNTSIGHLYCFVRDKDEYMRICSSGSNWDKKYKIWDLKNEPVDEFYCSDAFEPRPDNWGYRG